MGDRRYKLVLIRPLGKSGSMFVHNLIDNHPSVLLIPIPFQFYDFWNRYVKFFNNELNSKKSILTFIFWLVQTSNLKYFFEGNSHPYYEIEEDDGSKVSPNFDFDSFMSLIEQKLFHYEDQVKIPSRAEVLVAFHEVIYELAGKPIDKAEVIVLQEHDEFGFEESKNDFDTVYNIITVRDPRNAYASYLKSNTKHLNNSVRYTKNISIILNSWYDTYINAKYFQQLYPNNILFIKTEELNANPKKYVEHIATFLNIENLPLLMIPTQFGLEKKGISMHNKNQKGFDKEGLNINRWMEICGEQEIILLETYFQDLFDRFGYKRNFSKTKFLKVLFEFDKQYLNRFKGVRTKIIYLLGLYFLKRRFSLWKSVKKPQGSYYHRSRFNGVADVLTYILGNNLIKRKFKLWKNP